MRCNQLREQLQQADRKGLETLPAEMQAHLADCADCREYAADLQYRDLLGHLPAAAPSAGFTEQALENAWAAREGRGSMPTGRTGWAAVAAAAVIALAVGVVLRLPGPVTGPSEVASSGQVVEVTPRTVREVDLLMVSARELPDARITLQMDSNVALEGYPDQQMIRWNTAIASGNNRLTLPVRLRGEDSGSIVVDVQSDGARKRMVLTVEPSAQTAARIVTIPVV